MPEDKIDPANETETTISQPTVDYETQQEITPENKIVFSDLVQVPVRKLDNLLNLVGELIIERDRMMASQADYAPHQRIRPPQPHLLRPSVFSDGCAPGAGRLFVQ